MTQQQENQPEALDAMKELTDFFGPPIHVVTRQQLLDDGDLVDVSEMAREAGIRVPVAVTREVWADCIEWTDDDSARQGHQDQSGRMWDVLWMAKHCAVTHRQAQSALFDMVRVPQGGKGITAVVTTLKLVLGGDDDGKLLHHPAARPGLIWAVCSGSLFP
jgi:hypothetical protein